MCLRSFQNRVGYRRLVEPIQKQTHLLRNSLGRRGGVVHLFPTICTRDNLHRARRIIAPGPDTDFRHTTVPGGKQSRMPRKQAILGQWLSELTGRIQHNLDDPVHVPVGGLESPDVDPKSARNRGADGGSVQGLPFDLAGFDHIPRQSLQVRLFAQFESQRLHAAEQSSLIVAHRCQRRGNIRLTPIQCRPVGSFPDVHYNLRAICGDTRCHSPQWQR